MTRTVSSFVIALACITAGSVGHSPLVVRGADTTTEPVVPLPSDEALLLSAIVLSCLVGCAALGLYSIIRSEEVSATASPAITSLPTDSPPAESLCTAERDIRRQMARAGRFK